MATEVRLRRGTAAEHEVFAGAPAEVTVDTTNNTLRVHDGETLGGHETMPRGILPSPIVPDTFLQAKADGSGYDGKTPAQVAEVVGPLIRAASQDEAGIVQLADAATAQGLTDALRVLTPATLGAAMNAHVLGMGQTWQDVTASRSAGTTYTNTTGRAISVLISTNNDIISEFYIDNVFINLHDATIGLSIVSALIPSGSTYRLAAHSTLDGFRWLELR